MSESQNPLRLVVLARDQSARVQNAWREMAKFLEHQPGVTLVAAAVTDDHVLDDLETDLVVVLGGDGAILRACRQMGMRQLPIVGVNLGRLGFLAELSPAEFRQQLPRLQARDYQVVDHLMFECTFKPARGDSEKFLGLNEVVLSCGGSFRMLDVHLAIDNEPVTTYSCDGLIVSTPVGSTAYSLAAGGPILRHDLQAFVVTPISPHTLTNRPLVESADCVYTLTLQRGFEGAAVVIDGQVHRPLREGDVVEVRRAAVTFKLARVSGLSYYATLRRKLDWGGQPRYVSDQPGTAQ
jgi:NAD+ kinase